MTPTDTAHLVRYLGELFPRWKTNAATIELWVTRLGRRTCSLESATLVVEQHRADRKGSDPDLGQVEAKMKACEPTPGLLSLPRTSSHNHAGEAMGSTGFTGAGLRDFCTRAMDDEAWLNTLSPGLAQAVVNYGLGKTKRLELPGVGKLAGK